MSYLLNVSFVLNENIEQQFALWSKNNPVLEHYSLFRMIGSKEGNVTYCAQIAIKSITEIQQRTSDLHSKLNIALKKDFNEEIIYFMSALESL